MAKKNLLGETQVPGHQRVSHLDGHDVNHSYKVPSPTGRENKSYMHPTGGPGTGIAQAFKTADQALAEAHRPLAQIGPSKTVFPVRDSKVRGQPARPALGKTTAASKAGNIPLPGAGKPTIF